MLTDFNQELTMKKVILASLLAAMMGTSPVWAADNATAAPAAAATAQVQKEAADVLQVAVQGANAMRDVQFARLALFHGQPESAKKLTDDAAALLAADDASWAKFVKTDATAKMIADRLVINATIALSEDYVATPEKESAIKSANEKLAKGDQKGAIDTLRLAGIGVIENQYLMPLNQTRKAVAQAQKLLKAGKYYEANLVLKGAEEGIVVDSEMLVAGN
ncbi:YfdX family protein [Klebsiella quasipneumoniae subsp. similipneumoniae]|uniref:YfdX family protein n=1 Tax=Klebsiella quasipneumoniae TaxID=1463165 RepID=UPI001F25664E|nr:YfdX family protein [Klebsiella quasipneumoniae]MCF2308578.1 YfdX family protein [Klebsiella quasipneumoniae subsp. similipneumoniae]